MSADILQYLNEVDTATQKKVLAFIRRKAVAVQFKTPGRESVETAQFVATGSIQEINLVLKKKIDLQDHEITFKIKVGTDVYFFKSQVVIRAEDHFIKGPFKIFKLMRRKDTRFEIPETWLQNSFILSPQKKTFNSKINALEISSSGMRFVVYPQLPRYEKAQQIQLSLQFQKRHAFVVDAVIKHARSNATAGPTLGVEFIFENGLIKSKIQNICDDLAYALAQNLAVKL